MLSIRTTLFALLAYSSLGHAFPKEVGPIWNNEHSFQVCPAACEQANATWDGHWWTTIPGQESACGCAPKAPSPDCEKTVFCPANMQPARCTDPQGRTVDGNNRCAAQRELQGLACNNGESFAFSAVSCVSLDPFE